ncbi:MAG TPA: periplasmic heavy metal sensor [Gemmatimonadales bacterium]|nr:periplasmic heavy metal sensor [Gemmatimonadales bacterium]
MRTSTWKAMMLLIIAALLGGAVGSVVTARVIEHGQGPPDRPGGGSSEWYVTLLTRELDLSARQQDSVRTILKRHRRGMDSLWATLDPQMQLMREGIRAEVRTLLSPAQVARYAEVTAELDAQRKQKANQDSTNR